jgi:hypothetical protein
MHINAATLANLLHDYGIGEVRRDYSGRGMLGQTCVGVVTDAPTEVGVRLVGAALDDFIEEPDLIVAEVARVMHGARTDDMGKSTVVYWPELL